MSTDVIQVRNFLDLSLLGVSLTKAYPNPSNLGGHHQYVYEVPENNSTHIRTYEKDGAPKDASLLPLFKMTLLAETVAADVSQDPVNTFFGQVIESVLFDFKPSFQADTLCQLFETACAVPVLLRHLYQRKEHRLQENVRQASGFYWIIAQIQWLCWSYLHAPAHYKKIEQMEASFSKQRDVWYDTAIEKVKNHLWINARQFGKLAGIESIDVETLESTQGLLEQYSSKGTLTNAVQIALNKLSCSADQKPTLQETVDEARSYKNKIGLLFINWVRLADAKYKVPAIKP